MSKTIQSIPINFGHIYQQTNRNPITGESGWDTIYFYCSNSKQKVIEIFKSENYEYIGKNKYLIFTKKNA